MPNNLDVKITADVVDLQTKFAVARAEVSGLTAEMNKLARASAAGVIDPAGTAKLRQVAGDLIHARGEAGALAGALERAGGSAASFGARAGESRIAVGMAAREFRTLSTELSRGEFGRAPIAIARLAHSLFEVSPATMLAVGAFAGLAAALAFVIVNAIKTQSALDRMQIGAAFAGNLDLTRAKLQQFAEQLAGMPGVSTSAAQKIVEDLTRIPNLTEPAFNALIALVPSLSTALGVAADKGGEEVKRFLDPKVTAEHLVGELRAAGAQVTDAQRLIAEQADKTGNAFAIQAAKIQLLGAISEKNADIEVNARSRVTSSWSNFFASIGLAEQGIDAESTFVEDNTKAWKANTEAQAAGIALTAKREATPEMKVEAGVELAKKENPLSEQIDDARAKVEQLTTDLAAAKAVGSPEVSLLNDGLTAAKEKLATLEWGPSLDRMREQMQQVAIGWDGLQSGMLAKQREVAAAALAEVRKNVSEEGGVSKEAIAIQQEIGRLDVEIRRATGSELIAEARRVNTEISGDESKTAAQRLTAERATLEQLAADTRLSGNQRVAVEQEVSAKTAEINRSAVAERQAIARSDADTDIRIRRMQIDATRATLDMELQAQQITAAQKLATLRELATAESALDIQGLNTELATLDTSTAKYHEVYNQIREAKEKLTLDLAAMDKQASADAMREIQKEATAWAGAVSEIEGAENTMLGDLLAKRKSFSQSAIQAAGQLVDKEIQDDVRAMTTRLLLGNTLLAQQKAQEQGGVLFHALSEHVKVADTARSEAAQSAAVEAGGAVRITATETAAIQSKAAQNAVNGPTVMADAAKAFAGTYASVSSIPVIGWVLAPLAAAGAYAAVAAYEGLASLDVGAWNVPQDMTARIHAGEAVVPRPYAEGMRAMGGAGGAARGGDTYGDTNVNAHFHGAALSSEVIVAHLRKAVRNAHPATLR